MKKICIILILCLSIFLGGCSDKISDVDNNLISIKSIENLNNSDGIVYFGRPTCPNCEQFLPILKKVLKDKNKKIYYFNTDEWRNNEKFQDILDQYNIKQIPSIIRIKNGNSIEQLDILNEVSDLNDEKYVEKKLDDFIE